MTKRSLDEIVGSFDLPKESVIKDGQMIGIWLPKEYKARYDAIQKSSRRGLTKLLREVVQAAIDAAETKTA